MATYTNLNIPRLADGALQAFVKNLAPLAAFSRSFSPQVAGNSRGNTVLVPLIGALTATTFNGAYNVSGGTQSAVTVTLSQHKFIPVGQRDLDAMNNSNGDLEALGFQMGAALATLVIEDILTLVTTANFALATAVASTAVDVPQLRIARKQLNIDNVPFMGRSMLLDVPAMDALLGVTNFVQAYMFADNTVLREGRVMRALGFDFYEINGSFLPTTNSVNIFACQPSAVAVAMRAIQPQSPDKYDFWEIFSDPRTGLTFGMRDFYLPQTGERFLIMECNYGYSAGITNAGRIIKRTD